MKHLFLPSLLCFIFSSLTFSQSTLWGVTGIGGEFNAGVIYKTDATGSNFSVQKSLFQYDGDYPLGSVTLASDGKLYGTTSSCCTVEGRGVLFSYDPATSTYTKLFDFYEGVNGMKPYGSLIQVTDGKLYGTASSGGSHNAGAIFKYDIQLAAYTKVFDFSASAGKTPLGSLVQTANGKLYGLTSSGGAKDNGVLFSYDLTTSIYKDEYDFDDVNGSSPQGALIQAQDGKLYGMTSSGGAHSNGVIFQFDPVTSTLTKKFDFDGINGAMSYSSLMQANDGNLYGMTMGGGKYEYGVIFSFNPSTSTYTKKFDFNDTTLGSAPRGDLIQVKDGKLYGLTQYGGKYSNGVLFQFDITTSELVVKYNYNTEGRHPHGSLTQLPNGTLYGMAYDGGENGVGTFFKYDLNTSTFTKKFDFHGAIDGNSNYGSLLLANDNRIYGTTLYGGTYGNGTIFKMDPKTLEYTKLADFNKKTTGYYPTGSLIQATDGKLYGMTSAGGNHDAGAIIQFDPVSKTLTNKMDFDGANSGSTPTGALIQAKDGKLYGMTSSGGANNMGVLFQFDPSNATYSKKIDFDGLSLGSSPYGSLLEAADGNLYGMTGDGGKNSSDIAYNGFGVLFQFNPSTFTLVKKYDFDSISGGNPRGSLIQAKDGKLYGLTLNGGKATMDEPDGFGVLFQFDPTTSTYAKKIEFDGGNKGSNPNGSLLQATDGKLYGVTYTGGTNNIGTLFQVDPTDFSFVKKWDFNRKTGKYPDHTGLIEIIESNSVKDLSLQMIHIYPNPVQDLITISMDHNLKDASLTLYSYEGKAMTYRSNITGDKIILDVSKQAPGVYFLELRESGKVSTSRFVKQ